jgi:hypothetical protein
VRGLGVVSSFSASPPLSPLVSCRSLVYDGGENRVQ